MKSFSQSFWIGAVALCFSVPMGCNSENTEYKSFDEQEAPDEHAHADEHEHKAKHGGRLYEVGEHAYHAEVVVDEEHHKLTVHILDAHAENPHAIEQKELMLTATIDGKPSEFKLTAVAGGGDGMSSQFEIENEELVEYLHDNEKAEAELKLHLGGKDFSVMLGHAGHEEDEAHEHGGDTKAHGKNDGHKQDDGHKKHGEHEKDGEHKDGEHKDGEHKDGEHKDGEHKDGDADSAGK